MFAEHNANGKEEELVAQFLKSDVIRASLSSVFKEEKRKNLSHCLCIFVDL